MNRAMTGFRAWLVQRFSALYMLLFVLFILVRFAFAPPDSYATWRAFVLSPGVNAAASVFFIALLAHIWVGVRDIVLDYVKPFAARALALGLLGFGLVAVGTWLARILWMGP